MISRDNGSFYSKPMLSNALAMKKEPQTLASFDAMAMAAQLGAWIRVGQNVERILPDQHALVVDHALLGYSKLVLATGADPRRLKVPGDGAADVMSINDLGDYARFRLALTGCRSVAILGAGLIGCEFANDLAAAGYAVHLIDPAAHPASRCCRRDGRNFRARARSWRHSLSLGRSVQRIDRLSDGYRLSFADAEPSMPIWWCPRSGLRRVRRWRRLPVSTSSRAFAPTRGAVPASRIFTRSVTVRRSTAKCSRMSCRSCMPPERLRVLWLGTHAGRLPRDAGTVKTPASPAVVVSPRVKAHGRLKRVNARVNTQATRRATLSRCTRRAPFAAMPPANVRWASRYSARRSRARPPCQSDERKRKGPLATAP